MMKPMLKRFMTMAASVAVLAASSGFVSAADNMPARESPQTDKRERVHASQLMTRQERDEYRAKKHNAKTAEEKDRVRKEHNDRMKARAKERAAAAKPVAPAAPANPAVQPAPAAQ